MIELRQKFHSAPTSEKKHRVHIWIIHEILYEIDTNIEYLKLKFQIGTIRKTSVIFVNASKMNVSYF